MPDDHARPTRHRAVRLPPSVPCYNDLHWTPQPRRQKGRCTHVSGLYATWKTKQAIGLALGILSVIIAFALAWFLYSQADSDRRGGPGASADAYSHRDQSRRSMLLQGDRLFKRGQYEQAIAAYRRATELDPGLATAYARWAHTLVLRHRPAEAEPLARRAVELDSESAESQAVLGITLDWNGKDHRGHRRLPGSDRIGARLCPGICVPGRSVRRSGAYERCACRQPSTRWNWRPMMPWYGVPWGISVS